MQTPPSEDSSLALRERGCSTACRAESGIRDRKKFLREEPALSRQRAVSSQIENERDGQRVTERASERLGKSVYVSFLVSMKSV